MSSHVEWTGAHQAFAELAQPGAELGDGIVGLDGDDSNPDGVRPDIFALCTGDAGAFHVIEGTAAELLAWHERCGHELHKIPGAAAVEDAGAILASVREMLTETDWSGVLYDGDVLGAIAEAVGVERQD